MNAASLDRVLMRWDPTLRGPCFDGVYTQPRSHAAYSGP